MAQQTQGRAFGCLLHGDAYPWRSSHNCLVGPVVWCLATSQFLFRGGDCRSVVGRKGKDGNWIAIELTQDHQIDTHEGEKQRLLSEHPNEPDIIKSNRVKGRLQVHSKGLGLRFCESFGVFFHSQLEDWETGFTSEWNIITRYGGPRPVRCSKITQFQLPRVHKRYIETGWHPPYTTARPDISHYEITEGDRFIVLGSDGLFQVRALVGIRLVFDAVRCCRTWTLRQ